MPNLDDQRHAQFLRLFAEHEAALHTLLRAMLPSREDAKEALQETILVLWQKFGEYDPARDFRFLASGIARNNRLEGVSAGWGGEEMSPGALIKQTQIPATGTPGISLPMAV